MKLTKGVYTLLCTYVALATSAVYADHRTNAQVNSATRELERSNSRFAIIADDEHVLRDVRQEVRDLSRANDDLYYLTRRDPSAREVRQSFDRVDSAYRALRYKVRVTRVSISYRASMAFRQVSLDFERLDDAVAANSSSGGIKDPWVFVGAFDRLPVRFEGDRPEIYDDCMRVMRRTRDRTRSVEVRGRTYYAPGSGWDAEAVCGIAVLNSGAESGREALLNVVGKIGDAPVAVRGKSIKHLRVAMEENVPRIASAVSSIQIDGRTYYNSRGTWSANSVVQILYANVDDPRAEMTVEGVIQDAPFIFQGPSRDHIMKACTVFMDTVYGDTARSFTANGKTFYPNGNTFTVEQVCMAVSARAVDQ